MNKKKTIGVIIFVFVIISVIGICCLLKLNRRVVYIPSEKSFTRSDVENMIDFYVVEYDSFEDVIYYEKGTKIFENNKETFEKIAQYLKENHPNRKIVYMNQQYQINLMNQKYIFKQILDGYIIEQSYFSVESKTRYYTKFNEDYLFIEKVCTEPKISVEQIKSSTIDYLCKNSEICASGLKVKIYKCIYNDKESWEVNGSSSWGHFQLVIDAKTGAKLYSNKDEIQIMVD